MNTKCKYEIDSTNGIFYKRYNGLLKIEDIIKSWDEAIAENLIPKNSKRFIIDCIEGLISYIANDREIIENYYKNHPQIFDRARIAIVTIKPQNIIMPMLMKCERKPYSLAPFSTMKAAIEWVMNENEAF